MIRLDVNTNRSGKATAGGSAPTPLPFPRGCEILPYPEEYLTDVAGSIYLFNWGPDFVRFMTPQQYLDGVENGESYEPSIGVYALVCHDDPSAQGVQVVHYLMKVHGMSAAYQSASGERIRTMYAELISCPGGGGMYEYIYMSLYVRVPENGTPVPADQTVFRPSYDRFYWPEEGMNAGLKWTCDVNANELSCASTDLGVSYNYKPVMIDATSVSPMQRADGCCVQLSVQTATDSYIMASRLFSLVAATAASSEGGAMQFWLGLQYVAPANNLQVVFVVDDAQSSISEALGGPCKVINYDLYTNVEVPTPSV